MNCFLFFSRFVFYIGVIFSTSVFGGTGGIIGGAGAKYSEDKIVKVQICGAESNECEEKQYILGQNQMTRIESNCLIDKGEAMIESRCVNQDYALPGVVDDVKMFLYQELKIIGK